MKGVRSGPQALVAPLSAPGTPSGPAPDGHAPFPERESGCAESPGSERPGPKALPSARPRWSSSIRAEPLHADIARTAQPDLHGATRDLHDGPQQGSSPLGLCCAIFIARSSLRDRNHLRGRRHASLRCHALLVGSGVAPPRGTLDLRPGPRQPASGIPASGIRPGPDRQRSRHPAASGLNPISGPPAPVRGGSPVFVRERLAVLPADGQPLFPTGDQYLSRRWSVSVPIGGGVQPAGPGGSGWAQAQETAGWVWWLIALPSFGTFDGAECSTALGVRNGSVWGTGALGGVDGSGRSVLGWGTVGLPHAYPAARLRGCAERGWLFRLLLLLGLAGPVFGLGGEGVREVVGDLLF